ncbi:hypothetical protein TPHA_0L01010 [Tetrapisispora phaffii CBS 4417]|uniref:DNA topoisomerase n=1 Tax=Tetrapisispora phaffii (strain ATCC 24235 / CBS 4417 / NBRC 1672 / NRRL Y-8282 / UCD 70-5) TaxID=1071381 RepID=G8BZY0_TETPH|nr:hypothetical protein TPHA_0L01010 [Tetrapisispora phaffii CBS 4417]CCE65458.1 hypothetical protein TPHA_0L01010 [Tetrapisispora phaffii CBS 4417]
MRVLCVAEKNSIAKAVSQILGGGSSIARDSGYMYVKNYDFNFSGFPFADSRDCQVTMTSVAGHLTGVDFANERYGWGKCAIHELFDAPLSQTLDKNQKKIADNIKREARNADALMIWTDCDREGEYIGWEILIEAKKGNGSLNESNIYRAVFSHLERSHILHAARNPKRLDMNSVHAVGTRMEIDLRAGVSFTRLLTETMKPKICPPAVGPNRNKKKENIVISYGTCQFPTLGFVVDRFERIRNFIPEEFWYIQLQIANPDPNITTTTPFQWEKGHLFDRLSVLTFYELCIETAGNKAKVIDLKSKPTSKYRPLPLTTVELQKNCARFLKINAKQSLDAAEKLYQKGFLSYPRTETDIFPKTMDLKKLVEKQAQLDQTNSSNRSPWADYAKNLLSDNIEGHSQFQTPRAGTHDDKAHPPIHPIIALGEHATITPVERRVYEYVVRHFLACCSEDGKGTSTTLILDWAGEKFTATGIVVLQRNFLDVYPWAKWETTKQLPRLEMNQLADIVTAEMRSGSTSPPKPMTESELIMLMDANGIGTDATIAEHIEKIQARNYIRPEKVGKESYLQPTTLGIALVHGFEEMGLEDSFAKPFQRREMEEDLKKICDGIKTRQEVTSNIVTKYRNYYRRTNTSKNKLLEVYDRVKNTII